MEQTDCSETSAYKIQTPGNYPEEKIQHTEHGESLKFSIELHNQQRIVTPQNNSTFRNTALRTSVFNPLFPD
jgi:hypothetical protein